MPCGYPSTNDRCAAPRICSLSSPKLDHSHFATLTGADCFWDVGWVGVELKPLYSFEGSFSLLESLKCHYHVHHSSSLTTRFRSIGAAHYRCVSIQLPWTIVSILRRLVFRAINNFSPVASTMPDSYRTHCISYSKLFSHIRLPFDTTFPLLSLWP
jgi:hypothetical protein